VLEAFSDVGHPMAIRHLAVSGLPGSGTPTELMRAAGISVADIVRAASEATGT
jgi:transketolase